MATNYFTINIFLFIIGLVVLIKGSDWFIEASSYIARHYKIPEIVIGLTLVSIGTSLPELATAVYASATGEGGIALGDIVGANITNMTLVLGLGVTLCGVLPVSKVMLKRDTMIMLIVYVVFILLSWTGGKVLGRIDGLVLLLLLGAYYFLLLASKKSSISAEDDVESDSKIRAMKTAGIIFTLGLILVFFGAKMMVDNVVWIARKFNIPQELIAATIVALGTTIPELAVTIAGVVKKRSAIALGNILGSCIVNILLILGVSSLIRPLHVETPMFVSMLLMLGSGVIMLLAMITGTRLNRAEGILLLSMYAIFFGYNLVLALA